jgi:RNA recognition motif-containing protein
LYFLILFFTVTDEPKLRDAFQAFGQVTDVFLPSDRETKRPRGFGFVTFARRPDAEEAISKMDGAQLDGRTIRVNESRPRGEGPSDSSRSGALGPGGRSGFNLSNRPEVKLYVGNLSFESTDQSVRALFEQYGTVTDCFLPTDRDTGKLRGFAFVTMPAADAEAACAKTNGAELDGRNIRVNEAQPKGAGGPPPSRGGYSDAPGGYGGRPQYDDYRGGGGGGSGGGGRYYNDSVSRAGAAGAGGRYASGDGYNRGWQEPYDYRQQGRGGGYDDYPQGRDINRGYGGYSHGAGYDRHGYGSSGNLLSLSPTVIFHSSLTAVVSDLKVMMGIVIIAIDILGLSIHYLLGLR